MRGRYIFTYTLFVIANLITMLDPFFLGKFLNAIQEGGPEIIKNSAIYLGLYTSASIVFWFFHGPARYMERIMSFKITQNFSEHLFNVVTKLPLKWHKDNHTGKTIDKIYKARSALRNFTDEAYVYIESLIPFLVSLTVILIIMKLAGLIIILFGVIVVFIIFKFDSFLTKSLREINRREHKVAAVLYDYISNIGTIITLRLEKLAKNEYAQKILNVFPVFKKNVIFNEAKWFAVSAVMTICGFSVLMYYVYNTYTETGTVLAGNLIMLYGYIDKFINVFYGVAWKYERLVMTSTNLTTVDSILEAYDKFYSTKKFRQLKNDWRQIEINNLSFRYEDESHHIQTLENIDLVLNKGQKIALVGESGSGKSTLMSIIRGLTIAHKAKIKADGKDLKDLRCLSNIATLIPQDPEIFENTIEYNITMGMTKNKREIEKAIKIACFDKVAGRLPQKLQTDIREKGVNLSGGEKQRLALARGIFAAKNSSIVLLDEPTSSVDSTNELKIYRNLFGNFHDKCVVSSVHRLHLLPLFDMIYVFNNGKIVEEGNFKTLLKKKNGVLKSLWGNYENSLKTKMNFLNEFAE